MKTQTQISSQRPRETDQGITGAHSPLPWALEIGPEACFHKGNRVSIVRWYECDGEKYAETVAEVWPTDGDQDIADAKLIVASVNHSDKLAEALNELDMAHNHKTLCRAKERARQALANWEKAK